MGEGLETGLVVFLLLSNATLAWCVYRNVRTAAAWAEPLPIVMAYYLINYPLRSLVLLSSAIENRYGITNQEIVSGLTYSTMFMGLLVSVYYGARARGRYSTTTHVLSMPARAGSPTLYHALFFGYVAAYVYNVSVGGLLPWGETESTNLLKVARLLLTVKWYLLTCALLPTKEQKSKAIIAEAVIVAATIVMAAVVSTGKGELVMMLIVYVMAVGARGKRVPVLWVGMGMAFCLVFSVYSYLVRHYGDVYSGASVEIFVRNAEKALKAAEDFDVVQERGVKGSANRFDGLDGLVLCQRRATFLEPGPYKLGSAVELGTLIPKFIWPERPFWHFNSHLTQYVWGFPDYFTSYSPVGRIGESFFVMNWAGLGYALLYGVLWRVLYVHAYEKTRSMTVRAAYVTVALSNVFSDDNLFANVTRVAFVVALTTVAVLLEKRTLKPSRVTGSRVALG